MSVRENAPQGHSFQRLGIGGNMAPQDSNNFVKQRGAVDRFRPRLSPRLGCDSMVNVAFVLNLP